jgi:hypothetical protein
LTSSSKTEYIPFAVIFNYPNTLVSSNSLVRRQEPAFHVS